MRSFCFAYKIKPLGTPSGTFTLRVNRKQYRTYYFYDKNKLQFIGLTRMNINEKINGIINVQLMIINVQNNARSAPKLKR